MNRLVTWAWFGVALGLLGFLSSLGITFFRNPANASQAIVPTIVFGIGVAGVVFFVGMAYDICETIRMRLNVRRMGRLVSALEAVPSVEVGEGVSRSLNGELQVRRTLSDQSDSRIGGHIHVENLDPSTGLVRESSYVRIMGPRCDAPHSTVKQSANVSPPVTRHVVGHFAGVPPEFNGGKDTRVLLLPAIHIAIHERSDGVFLERYDMAGSYAGDTWHENVARAIHQAAFEYGDSLGTWCLEPNANYAIGGFPKSAARRTQNLTGN